MKQQKNALKRTTSQIQYPENIQNNWETGPLGYICLKPLKGSLSTDPYKSNPNEAKWSPNGVQTGGPNGAQMEPGGVRHLRFEPGCKNTIFVRRFGSQNGPPNGPSSRLELSFGAFFPHLFFGPIWSSIVEDFGVKFMSILKYFFVVLGVRPRTC